MAQNNQRQTHFVLFPYMAQGHIIPMVDIARLLASRGVVVTILLTTVNSRRMQPAIDRAVTSGLSIHVCVLKHPSAEAGLPEGCENVDVVTSFNDAVKLFMSTTLLKDQVEHLLKELEPCCLISDMCLPWAADLAEDLGIPRLVFHGTGCFPMVMWNILQSSKAVEAMSASDTDYFVVPDLPDRIEITKAQLRGAANQLQHSVVDEVNYKIRNAEIKSFGTIANTFEELEPKYIEQYVKRKNTRIWCIGPVSLCNKEELDKAERGDKASIDNNQCLEWLDSQKLGSVVYVCLGSWLRIDKGQLIELGLALEALNRPFIWVVKNVSDEFKAWLVDENFEERVKTRQGRPGLLIHGWAPQVLILSHPSVGGFLTHCGWNSTLEGITAGMPMVTWPVSAEQFSNEKFVVNVIKTGVRVGIELPVLFAEVDKAEIQVRSGEIRMAIDEVMDGGDEGEARRERARKLGEMAKKATEDEKGSSYVNITRLIRDVQQCKMR